eukprot:357766-Chlamydomonas_euryale.AAC.1
MGMGGRREARVPPPCTPRTCNDDAALLRFEVLCAFRLKADGALAGVDWEGLDGCGLVDVCWQVCRLRLRLRPRPLPSRLQPPP